MADETTVPESAAAEKTADKKKKGIGVNFKVSAKGAVSVYGLGRFPVTLYREQWLRLLERTDDLRKFMDERADDLKAKGDQTPAAQPVAPEGEPILGASGEADGASDSSASESSNSSSGAGGDTELAVTPDDAGGNEQSEGRVAEMATTANDPGAALKPGTKTVDATGDMAYGDDYVGKNARMYRPGNPPGVDPKPED